MDSFYIHILAEDHVIYRGNCLSMTVPIADGQYGILAHHSNMVAAIVPGELSFVTEEGKHHSLAVSLGLVKVENNEVLLLVESAEYAEEIDLNRARQMERAAKEAILANRSAIEFRNAQASLLRAINRINVKSHHISDK